ncbi:hypothetical protein MKW98_016367 [Papaver atlanticum]|uniref:Uncharacterized protein n=1 Tax=Papaver atlanticum TaxID=357466 RepID=A0AAD4X3K1_9MAGN|nr:hypothetical protein MKW98_016367 [Papaver atlanticum]
MLHVPEAFLDEHYHPTVICERPSKLLMIPLLCLAKLQCQLMWTLAYISGVWIFERSSSFAERCIEEGSCTWTCSF